MAVCSPLTHPHICYDWKLIAIISTLHFSIQSFQHWKWWVCRTNEPSRRQESQLELQLQRRRLECCRRYERPIDLHLALWQLSYVRVLCSFIAYPFRFVFPNLLDHILATAATNGAVVTWNLNKSSRSKQDIVFQDHKRTVNKVCFHPSEASILLSGSQDGTMKCFDIRKREAVSTFLR